jgi:hypothetical protein
MKTKGIKETITLALLFFITAPLKAQVSNTGLMDTSGGTHIDKLTIGGYLDLYYGGVFSKVSDNYIPYLVNMNRQNEFSLNLVYIDLRYDKENFRARFVPGFGTFMNANYASEPGSLQNIVEALAGFKLSKKKDIWLDAGVLGSPYTNETPFSKDHLMYTRSFGVEYVPYYLSGLKLSVPIKTKLIAYLYILNGWQQIKDNNSSKSLGTQIEYRPDKKNLINWDTYIGNEQSDSSSQNRMRYFTDVYWIFNPVGKFSVTASAYIGNQQRIDSLKILYDNIWWQANFVCRYSFNKRYSLSGRVEYFNDDYNVQITPINQIGAFRAFSTGLCFNIKANENALIRFEGRQFFSDKNMFRDYKGNPDSKMIWLVSNLTVWF